jgi:hypothetical protein
MGTWGAGLYSDDTTCEVRDEFRARLSSGETPANAESQILTRYEHLLTDEQIACLIYFSLADTQWGFGCLSELVKTRAEVLLAAGGDLKHWKAESPADVRVRRRTLETLGNKLKLPQPAWKPPPLKKARSRRRQIELPLGAVLGLDLPENQVALLKIVGFLPVGNIDTPVFRVLPWHSVDQPTGTELAAIAEQWVKVDGHHEFSILFDGRKKLTSFLHQTDIVLESTTPMDMSCWRAMGTEILQKLIAEALSSLRSAP